MRQLLSLLLSAQTSEFLRRSHVPLAATPTRPVFRLSEFLRDSPCAVANLSGAEVFVFKDKGPFLAREARTHLAQWSRLSKGACIRFWT